MTEYTTLRVTVDAKEQAEQSKTDDETWNDYIKRCTDNPPEVREFVDRDSDIDEVIREMEGQLTYDDVVNACAKAIREELPEVQR